MAQVLKLFIDGVKNNRPEEDEVLSNLDNQMHWFWNPHADKGTARDAAMARLSRDLGEPGYDVGRMPSIERIVRFMISRPIDEVRRFLRKERKADVDNTVTAFTTRVPTTRGGSNTNDAVKLFAEALGCRPQVALVRRILADACRRRGDGEATYPFVVSSLAEHCVAEFDLKGAARRRAFNPNPQLTAIDVEHLIAFLCGRNVPDLERLLARSRAATDTQIARERETRRLIARLSAGRAAAINDGKKKGTRRQATRK